MIDHEALHLTFRARLDECALITSGMTAWGSVPFKRTTGQPYLETDFAPLSNARVTFASRPQRTERGLYVVRWYGVSGEGEGKIRAAADAILALFDLDWSATLDDGSTVLIRGDVAPWAGQIIPSPIAGWSVCTITIPWEARTRAGAPT